MRRFIVLGHKAAITPEFTLNDLPGSAGRLDILCRAIGAAFFLSHDIRRNVEVTLLLQDKVQIRLVGDKLRHLNPDERSTGALLKKALEQLAEEEVQSTPGIYVSPYTLPQVVDRMYQQQAHPIVLHEKGVPIDDFSFPDNPAFFLSDHQDFNDDDINTLADLPHVSLGSQLLHANHCVTIINYLVDRHQETVDSDLVLCHKVWNETEANLIKGLLEDFDIPSNLVTHVPPSVLPMTVNGLAEVRIMVTKTDLNNAKEIINDYFRESITD